MIHRSTFIFRTFCLLLWTVTCYPFVLEELLPPLLPLRGSIMLLTDALMALLGVVALCSRYQPRQLGIIGSFFILAFISTILLNNIGWVNLFNGSRQFFGMLFAPAVVIYLLNCKDRDTYRRSLDRQLYAFLIVQAVCVTWQFLRYGANDHGGGSMGNGCSGIISTLIILISYYFTTRDFDATQLKKSLWRNRKYLILMYPVMLNETKVSFVFLALYFVLLFRLKGKSVVKLIALLPVAVAGYIGLQAVYQSTTGGMGQSLTDSSTMTEYLFSKDAEYDIENMQNLVDYDVIGDDIDGLVAVQDLPRFIKIAMTPVAVGTTPGGAWFGAGLGHFKGGTSVGRTDFYDRYEWLILGTVNIFMFLYMQLGILGFVWFGFYLAVLLDFRKKPFVYSMQLKLFLLAVAVMAIFYNDCFLMLGFCIIFAYLGVASTVPRPETEKS